jgi:ketosteroid isomerase-like protein
MQAPTGRQEQTERVMDEQATIQQLIADRAQAMRDGDAVHLIAGYAEDAIVYSLAPPLRQPASDNTDVQALQNWFDGHGGRVGYEVTDLNITIGDGLALCTSLNRMGAPDDTPGEKFSLWFRSTVALRRVEQRWLIVHEHTSTPFYMDGSLRAALDLTPL